MFDMFGSGMYGGGMGGGDPSQMMSSSSSSSCILLCCVAAIYMAMTMMNNDKKKEEETPPPPADKEEEDTTTSSNYGGSFSPGIYHFQPTQAGWMTYAISTTVIKLNEFSFSFQTLPLPRCYSVEICLGNSSSF